MSHTAGKARDMCKSQTESLLCRPYIMVVGEGTIK